jgi:hypothetical protein
MQAGFTPTGLSYRRVDRLAKVQTFAKGEPVRTYKLTYVTAANGTSLVSEITECPRDQTTSCKAPTRFTYEEESGLSQQFVPNLELPPGMWLDVNGDGLKDLLEVVRKVDGTEMPLWAEITDYGITYGSGYIPAGMGFVASFAWFAIKGIAWFSPLVTYDYRLYLNKGLREDPFYPPQKVTGLNCLSPETNSFITDYDSDGADDILELCGEYFISANRYVRDGRFEFAGNASSYEQNLGLSGDTQVADVNGDGLADLLTCEIPSRLSPGRIRIHLKKPGGGYADELNAPDHGGCNYPGYLMDVDGDGVTNYVRDGGPNLGWAVLDLRQTPAGVRAQWRTDLVARGNSFPSLPRFQGGDFNGDGLLDLIEPRVKYSWEDGTTHPLLWVNRGGQFVPFSVDAPPITAAKTPKQVWSVADLNHDQKSDILRLIPPERQKLLKFTPELTTYEETQLPGAAPFGRDGAWTNMVDVDGDGNLDFTMPSPDGPGTYVYYSTGARNNLLKRVVDGVGNYVDIKYEDQQAEENIGATYTPAPAGTCSWPYRCVQRLSALVSSYDVGLERGLTPSRDRKFNLTYEDARADVPGHGWLGFARRTIFESVRDDDNVMRRRSVTKIEYAPLRQYSMHTGELVDPKNGGPYVYPHAGLPHEIAVEHRQLGGAIQAGVRVPSTVTTNSWTVQLGSAGTPFPVLTAQTVRRVETAAATGARFTAWTDITTTLVDAFGNVTRRTAQRGTSQLTTEAQYDIDRAATEMWLISNPATVTVTGTRWNESVAESKQRHYAYEYWPNGHLKSVVRAPGDPSLEQKTTLYLDDWGNLRRVEVGRVDGTDTSDRNRIRRVACVPQTRDQFGAPVDAAPFRCSSRAADVVSRPERDRDPTGVR